MPPKKAAKSKPAAKSKATAAAKHKDAVQGTGTTAKNTATKAKAPAKTKPAPKKPAARKPAAKKEPAAAKKPAAKGKGKKQAVEEVEDDDEDDEDDEDDAPPPKKPVPRGRPKKAAAKNDDEDDEPPPKKKAAPRGRGKKAAAKNDDEDDEDDEPPPPPKKTAAPRGRPKKAAAKKDDEKDEDDEPAKTAPQGNKRKRTAPPSPPARTTGPATRGLAAKRNRQAAAALPAALAPVAADEDDDEDEEDEDDEDDQTGAGKNNKGKGKQPAKKAAPKPPANKKGGNKKGGNTKKGGNKKAKDDEADENADVPEAPPAGSPLKPKAPSPNKKKPSPPKTPPPRPSPSRGPAPVQEAAGAATQPVDDDAVEADEAEVGTPRKRQRTSPDQDVSTAIEPQAEQRGDGENNADGANNDVNNSNGAAGNANRNGDEDAGKVTEDIFARLAAAIEKEDAQAANKTNEKSRTPTPKKTVRFLGELARAATDGGDLMEGLKALQSKYVDRSGGGAPTETIATTINQRTFQVEGAVAQDEAGNSLDVAVAGVAGLADPPRTPAGVAKFSSLQSIQTQNSRTSSTALSPNKNDPDSENKDYWTIDWRKGLGQGAQGKVFRASSAKIPNAAAKVFELHQKVPSQKNQDILIKPRDRNYEDFIVWKSINKRTQKQFRREVRILAEMDAQKCENICNYLHHAFTFDTPNKLVLFMELAGGDIKFLLGDWHNGYYDPDSGTNEENPIDAWERRSLVLWDAWTDMCKAVMYLARLKKPIVHGDIKPENILFVPAKKHRSSSGKAVPGAGEPYAEGETGSSTGWTFKLADFGLATREGSSVHGGGTKWFQGPEFHSCDKGSECDHRPANDTADTKSDVYSLAATFTHLHSIAEFGDNQEAFETEGQEFCDEDKNSKLNYWDGLSKVAEESTPLGTSGFLDMLLPIEERCSIGQVVRRNNTSPEANWGGWVAEEILDEFGGHEGAVAGGEADGNGEVEDESE